MDQLRTVCQVSVLHSFSSRLGLRGLFGVLLEQYATCIQASSWEAEMLLLIPSSLESDRRRHNSAGEPISFTLTFC
jgi:hypothetical protein